uniref:Uncharacterized protein n=1 Tax=Dunaliella tertiolecta TaxID=3047 RepID=A0A7S3QK28_DUNTE
MPFSGARPMSSNNMNPSTDSLPGLIDPFADTASLISIMLSTHVKERAILLYRLLQLYHGQDPSLLSIKKSEYFTRMIDTLVASVQNLFSATSIIGTLLLSITIGAHLGEAPDPHEDAIAMAGDYGIKVISRIAAVLVFASSCLTMLAIWFAARWYIFLTCFCADHEDQLLFIMNENVALPTMLMIAGLFLVLFAVPLNLFLVYSVEVAVVTAFFAIISTFPIAYSDIKWQIIFLKKFNKKELVQAIKANHDNGSVDVFDCVPLELVQLREKVALQDIHLEEASPWSLLQDKMKAWIDMILQHQFPSGQLRTAEEYITLLSNLKSCEDIAEAEFNAWMSILMRIKKKLGRKQALQELQGLK